MPRSTYVNKFVYYGLRIPVLSSSDYYVSPQTDEDNVKTSFKFDQTQPFLPCSPCIDAATDATVPTPKFRSVL